MDLSPRTKTDLDDAMPDASKAVSKKEEPFPGWVKWDGATDGFKPNDLGLLHNGTLSDVKVVSGDRTWNVHSIILASRCLWFKTALEGPFLEAETRVIIIEEFPPESVDVVLHYIYSGGELQVKTAGDEGISAFVQLWVIADFFLLEPMRQSCLDQIKTHLEKYMKRTTNLSATLTDKEYETIFGDLSSGITAAYHLHPHAEPCQKLIRQFAFASRIKFLQEKAFQKIMTQERDFAHNLSLELLYAPEVAFIGTVVREELNEDEITIQKSFCEACETGAKRTTARYHDYNDDLQHDCGPAVYWTCEHCIEGRPLWY